MGPTGDVHGVRFDDKILNRRTVNEIQKSIDRQGKRITIARLLRGNDKEAIAAWRSDLDRILRVFNVRFIASVLLLLTFHRQTELVADTRRTAPTSQRGVPGVRAATSDVHHGTPIPDGADPNVRHDNPPSRPGFSEAESDNSDTRTISSDSHRDKQGGRDDACNQNSSVSATYSDCRWLAAHRCLELLQVSGLYCNQTHCSCLVFAFSAPGESPPLPNNMYETSSDVVSELQRDVVNTQTLVRDIHNLLKGKEGAGGQLHSVSVTRILPPPTKHSLLLRLKIGQHS